jgi:cytochrome P450
MTAFAPRLPIPTPRERPAGPAAFLVGIATNPLSLLIRRHYEELFVPMRGLLGTTAVVSDPAAIRHILIDNAASYRKDPMQLRVLKPIFGEGVLTADGADWRRQRRTLAPLFTPRRTALHARAMLDAGLAFRATLDAYPDGAAIRVDQAMAELTLDVLSRTILRGGLGTEPKIVTAALRRYLATAGRIDPLDVLGAPAWLPRLGRAFGSGAVQTLGRVVDDLVAARRGEPGAQGRDDLIAALLDARDPETGQGLTESEIRDNVLTLMAAGHETTANALTWTLLLLGAHPGVRAACEAEVDAAGPLDDDPAAAPDRLPLVKAVIEESMRLYPPAATLSREAIAPDVVAGHALPAGATVFISPWVVHRPRRLWDEPDAFRPERFLAPARDAVPRFSYLPFGAGPRICIGAAFALQEAVILLATLLRSHRFEMQPGADAPGPVQRVTVRPKGGLTMRAHRRPA